jgi:dimethylaniline monooxygenase (N-oxide forming)
MWDVETSNGAGPKTVQCFDKVVYSMGPDQTPNIPSVPGLEMFEGERVHSIEFKK